MLVQNIQCHIRRNRIGSKRKHKWYNVYHFEALNKYTRNIITFLAFGLKQQCPNDPHGRAKMTKG